jgi:hypothetical protein
MLERLLGDKHSSLLGPFKKKMKCAEYSPRLQNRNRYQSRRQIVLRSRGHYIIWPNVNTSNIIQPTHKDNDTWLKYQGPYSQHFIFFVTYESAQKARVLHKTWLERLANNKLCYYVTMLFEDSTRNLPPEMEHLGGLWPGAMTIGIIALIKMALSLRGLIV